MLAADQPQQEQFYRTKTGMSIDPARINTVGEEKIFQPFHVKSAQMLEEVLDRGRIQADQRLIAAQLPDGGLVSFLPDQLGYHHLAQGESNGQPWLVSF